MENVTITVTKDLKDEMKQHGEVNWSAVIRKALSEHLRKVRIAEAIARKSRLTKEDVDELDKLVKEGIAKNHK